MSGELEPGLPEGSGQSPSPPQAAGPDQDTEAGEAAAADSTGPVPQGYEPL